MDIEAKLVLRARDFWTSLVLMALAVFFLFKTAEIPFFNTANAGVRTAEWFNSAALVPFGLFGCLFLCAFGLMVISIREGGAARALGDAGIDLDRAELARITALAICLLSYIAGLVPRVDFVIASALVLTALFWGFHRGDSRARWIATALVAAPASYAMLMHLPQSEWRASDDDWVALAAWVILAGAMLYDARNWPEGRGVARTMAGLSLAVPLVLVIAMAFGFRQNVPARSGVFFSKIELAYYTQLRPWWRETFGEGE
ncbi:MAG: tripartite tricarboxylate transporter TctB family protein [Pseudomonadota bacterium]